MSKNTSQSKTISVRDNKAGTFHYYLEELVKWHKDENPDSMHAHEVEDLDKSKLIKKLILEAYNRMKNE